MAKFYWLKLNKDFFKQHEIRIIEETENGKDYILFYLKLLVESISHEGNLKFNDTIPYNDKMLSTITNTNIDVVRSAIKVFSELEMMKILDDGTIYMTETKKMIGQESKWAEYKRVERNDEKLLELDNVQKMSNRDKSIEIRDKSIDTNIINIYEYLEQSFGRTITSTEIDKIAKWLETIKEDVIRYAIEKATIYNKRSLSYIQGILNNWKDMALTEILDKENNKTKKGNTPEWFNQTIEKEETPKDELEKLNKEMEMFK